MESQVFSPAAYSPEATYYISADAFEGDENEVDTRWLHSCELAAGLDREDILSVVLDELREEPALLELIEDACRHPHEPGRPKTSLNDLVAIGKAALLLVVRAVDDQVSVKMALAEMHHD
jgi:hypothetical protein